MKMKKAVRLYAVLICTLLLSQTAFAATELSISHKTVREDKLCVYVENPGEYESVSCQIGQDHSESVEVKKITDSDISINTYLLIDNSLSIQEKYRDTMKQIAKGIILAGKENEKFTVATFDTEIRYLAENSKSSEELIQCVDQIAFQDLDTTVFDVLYRLYDKMETDDEESFKRIIFMSDGMETKTVGYTREELMEKAEEIAYPVYVLGCTYESNETELENMFRISRKTNAKYYQLDNIGSAEQVVAGINDSFDMVQVQMTIPENQQDGSLKGVKIAFETADGKKTASFSQEMPFLTVPETGESEDETAADQEGTTNEENAFAEAEDKISELTEMIMNKLTDKNVLMLGSICIFVIAVIILILVKLKKKRRPKKNEKKQEKEESSRTEFLRDERTEMIDDDVTGMAGFVNIRLIDTKRPSKIMEFSLESALVVGRVPDKAQIVFDYEKSISAQHCEIYRANGKVYIRDLHSSNGTYVDGILVDEAAELTDGSIIKIGRLQIEFQIV